MQDAGQTISLHSACTAVSMRSIIQIASRARRSFISISCHSFAWRLPTYLWCNVGKLSKAADVYAFGVLLWEMWTGSRPWSGLLQMQVIFHVTIQRKRLEFPEDTPGELKELALECMAREPKQRPRFDDIVERLGSHFSN